MGTRGSRYDFLGLFHARFDLRDVLLLWVVDGIVNFMLADDAERLLRVQLALSYMSGIAGSRRHGPRCAGLMMPWGASGTNAPPGAEFSQRRRRSRRRQAGKTAVTTADMGIKKHVKGGRMRWRTWLDGKWGVGDGVVMEFLL
jgi:hypothetical protein